MERRKAEKQIWRIRRTVSVCMNVRTVRACGYMRLLRVCYVHSGSVSQSFFTYGTSFLPFIFVTFVLVGKESLDGPLRNLL